MEHRTTHRRGWLSVLLIGSPEKGVKQTTGRSEVNSNEIINGEIVPFALV